MYQLTNNINSACIIQEKNHDIDILSKDVSFFTGM